MERFKVTGMSCAACSSRVEKAVAEVPGVRSVAVSLLTNSMGVEYEEGIRGEDARDLTRAICKAVSDAGYGAEPELSSQNPSAGCFFRAFLVFCICFLFSLSTRFRFEPFSG